MKHGMETAAFRGLFLEEIPLFGRIMAISEVYDALIS